MGFGPWMIIRKLPDQAGGGFSGAGSGAIIVSLPLRYAGLTVGYDRWIGGTRFGLVAQLVRAHA